MFPVICYPYYLPLIKQRDLNPFQLLTKDLPANICLKPLFNVTIHIYDSGVSKLKFYCIYHCCSCFVPGMANILCSEGQMDLAKITYNSIVLTSSMQSWCLQSVVWTHGSNNHDELWSISGVCTQSLFFSLLLRECYYVNSL